MKVSIWALINRIASSRIGQLLLLIHLILVVYDFAQKTGHTSFVDCTPRSEWNSTAGVLAGRYFHPAYESVLLKVLMFLDLPAILFGAIVLYPFYYIYPNICVYTASWIDAAVILLFASFQWLLVGCSIEWLIRKIFK